MKNRDTAAKANNALRQLTRYICSPDVDFLIFMVVVLNEQKHRASDQEYARCAKLATMSARAENLDDKSFKLILLVLPPQE